MFFNLPLLYSIIIPCHREIILPWNQALPYFLERNERQPPSHRQSPTITLPCNANCMAVWLGFIHLTLYLLKSVDQRNNHHSISHCYTHLNATDTSLIALPFFPLHRTVIQCQLYGGALGLYSSNTLPTLNLLSCTKPCGLLCIVIHSYYLHYTNGFLQHNTMRSWIQRMPASITSQISPLITLLCNANCMAVCLEFIH